MSQVIHAPSGAMTKRMRLEIQRAEMENERASFIAHWRDLGENILPRRPRFFTDDNNRGQNRNNKIIDSTATLASRTLRSGMMGGVTSPARPWFNLTTPDPSLSEVGDVKQWLYLVNQRMSTTFLKSNLYNTLPIIYGDMGTFATGCMLVDEDYDSVFRCYAIPIGSYCIALNEKLQVGIFRRDFQMTVRQIVNMFGKNRNSKEIDWSRISKRIQDHWNRAQFNTKIDVCHVIEPNEEYDPKSPWARHKKFADIYYEKGVTNTDQGTFAGNDTEKFLRESGYDYFPVLAPRWEVTGEDVYGTSSPGMDSLGDTKALQLMHRRKSQAIDKKINPPMSGPTSLRNAKTSLLPGDITFIDVREGQQGFKPVHEINFDTSELKEDIRDHQTRIKRAYFEDLFLMMSQSDRREITAREVDERHEEKLLALGPVLEQLNQDLLDPLVDIVFSLMVQKGLIPPPPKQLQGMPLKVEYTSIMAQAQKLLGLSSLDRFLNFTSQAAAISPSSLDGVNFDEIIRTYGEQCSVAPKILRTDDQIGSIREAKQKAQQQAAQAEQMNQKAQAAKNFSQANIGGDNALTRLMQAGQAGNNVPQQ